jgi:hypothetical protein
MRAKRREVLIVATAGEVVHDGHRVSTVDKSPGQVHSDEAGTAEQERLHGDTSPATVGVTPLAVGR